MRSFANSTAIRYGVLTAAVLLLVMLGGADGPRVEVASAAGCVPPLPHAPGTTVETISTADGLREYRLHVPPSYNGFDRVPLILNFHGRGSNSLQQELYSAFSTRADAPDGGFIVAYPQGLTVPLGSTYFNAWQLGSPFADDVAFVDTLLDALELSLCIDANRIFSTGMSNGGMMSVRLACSLSDRVAAIAPVTGAYYPPMALNLNSGETCPDTRSVPVMAFHGTADAVVPFNGGLSGGVDYRLPLENTTPDDDVLQSWAGHDGCTSARQESVVSGEVRLVTYNACLDGAIAQLYIVDGGGHTWPGAIDIPGLGYTTHDISATDLIWEFFQDHPLVSAPLSDLDGDTVPDLYDDDNDNDGCTDAAEAQLAPGSEATGGRRNAKNPYDLYDTDGNKDIDLFIDIFAVAFAFGDDADSDPPGEPDGYDANLDRSAPLAGDDPWDMQAPDGVIDLFTDVFGVAYQYGHSCAA